MAPTVLINSAGATANSEIVRHLKNRSTPHRGSVDTRKVARRTHKDYVHVQVDGSWRMKYDRLRSNLTRGFHTPCHKPYATVGKIYLDQRQLVSSGLSDYIDSKDAFWRKPVSDRVAKKGGLASKMWGELALKKEGLESHDGSTQRLVPLDDGVNNGSAYIRRTIKDWETTITAVKCGRGFEHFSKERETEKEEAARSLTGQKELQLVNPKNKHWSDATKNIKRMTDVVGNSRDDVEIRQQELGKTSQLEKLDMIDKLLTILHVMRSKDLKTRRALGYDYLKHLMGKYIPLDTGGRPIFSRAPRPVATAGTGHGHGGLPPGLLDSSPSSETVSSKEGGHVPSKYQVISGSVTSVSRTKSSSMMSPSTTAGGGIGLCLRYPHNRPPVPRVIGDRIDNWDDLVGISDKHTHRYSIALPRRLTTLNKMPTPSQYSYGQAKTLKRPQDSDRMPIWQNLPQFGGKTPKRATHTNPLPAISEEKSTDPKASGVASTISFANIPCEMKAEFDRVREKFRRKLVTDIAKINREKYVVYYRKFHALQLGHLMERNFEQMREDARALEVDTEVDNLEDANEPCDDVSTAKWFLNLKHECDCVLGDGNKEGNVLLKKISRFSLEDIHSIPKSKEKICLVIMSLPAYQILRPGIQKAAKFVLEDFLEMPTDAFYIFMNYRKLPVVI